MRKVLPILLSAAAGMALGLSVTQRHAVTEANAEATGVASRQPERLTAVFERIRTDYVDELDESKLAQSAINGMLGLLDSHSTYIDGKTFRDMQIQIVGELGFLGIESIMEHGFIKVVTPIDETPAAKAGIMAKDIITHIDDVPVQGLTLDQAIEKMRGPAKTKVRLKIMRKGQDKPIELTLVRELFRARPVRTRQEGDDIGYIRIAFFNGQTIQSLKKAIGELAGQIPVDKLKGYILDLRNNPGGLLDQAVSVADAFLEDGEIVSVRGRSPEKTERFSAQPGDIINGKSVVVLINGGSAAAAEIVAAALQDHRRATVIGTRSFGKASVPTIIPLGRDNGALRLTTARYFTPAGRSIHGLGVAPDIEALQGVSEDRENDKALTIAYDLLRGIALNATSPPNPNAATGPD
jgi:carboxyl-terminal processing protease